MDELVQRASANINSLYERLIHKFPKAYKKILDYEDKKGAPVSFDIFERYIRANEPQILANNLVQDHHLFDHVLCFYALHKWYNDKIVYNVTAKSHNPYTGKICSDTMNFSHNCFLILSDLSGSVIGSVVNIEDNTIIICPVSIANGISYINAIPFKTCSTFYTVEQCIQNFYDSTNLSFDINVILKNISSEIDVAKKVINMIHILQPCCKDFEYNNELVSRLSSSKTKLMVVFNISMNDKGMTKHNNSCISLSTKRIVPSTVSNIAPIVQKPHTRSGYMRKVKDDSQEGFHLVYVKGCSINSQNKPIEN